jgi:hypothetical protein
MKNSPFRRKTFCHMVFLDNLLTIKQRQNFKIFSHLKKRERERGGGAKYVTT